MAKKKTPKKTPSPQALRAFIRKNAPFFLQQENVTSVGIGYKQKDGKTTEDICVQFTVGEKTAPEALESLGASPLPESFTIDGITVPTDVLERSYEPAARVVELTPEDAPTRKIAVDPVVPGVSIGHPSISAGTAGCVAYDARSGTPYILSNWHVLNGAAGDLGDDIVQPGRHDDNRTDRNVVGKLVRSHLGIAGDCAIASIDHRRMAPEILDLNVVVSRIGEPELGDRVVKSGRTTDVTFGIVTRVDVVARINYRDVGPRTIGCFEIGPDPDHPAPNGEISMGGDSGSCWLFVDGEAPTDLMLGLHFAGETGNAPEQALACYPKSVFEKLEIAPRPPVNVLVDSRAGLGYQVGFIGEAVAIPAAVSSEVRDDLLEMSGRTVFDYMHFSLAMSRSRRFARWVAWNVDGAAIRRLSRRGISFRKDRNLPDDAQIGNELYVSNPLDRGHIARRADLVWGPRAEAQRANRDSFFYTNITPQHSSFNRSSANGIWGQLENAVFEDLEVEDLRVSVMAGPIFTENDPLHREIRLPRQFWKAIYFREAGDPAIQAKSYVLTQADLLNQLEVLELPEFSVFEVPISRIGEMTGLSLPSGSLPICEERRTEEAAPEIRLVGSVLEILA